MSLLEAFKWIAASLAGTLLICAWLWVKTQPWKRGHRDL